MVRQIKILAKAQLLNVWNINVVRYSKDRKKSAGMIAMAALWGLLVLMMAGYVGGAAYTYIFLGMEEVLPMYLGMIAGGFIFFFGMFQAGSVIFQKNSYDVLCTLPVSQTAVVVSRFLVMYLGNLLLAAVIMFPGMTVYGVMLRPALPFYVWGTVGTLFLPMLPMTVAVLFGAVIAAVSSRMKHKSMVATLLSVLLVFGLMAMGAGLSVLEERGELTADFVRNFSEVLSEAIASVYPPAVWLGQMMTDGSPRAAALYSWRLHRAVCDSHGVCHCEFQVDLRKSLQCDGTSRLPNAGVKGAFCSLRAVCKGVEALCFLERVYCQHDHGTGAYAAVCDRDLCCRKRKNTGAGAGVTRTDAARRAVSNGGDVLRDDDDGDLRFAGGKTVVDHEKYSGFGKGCV